MRDNHRHDAECRSGGGEEDRAHTAQARFVGGIADREVLGLAQLLRVLVHHYCVAHNHAYQCHQAQERRDTNVQLEDIQAKERAVDT